MIRPLSDVVVVRASFVARFCRFGHRGEQANLQQVKAKRLDVSQHAVEGRLIQDARQNRDPAFLLRHHRRERRTQRGSEVPVDPDRVERWVHGAIVGRGQVSPHRRDLVIAHVR